MLTKLSLPVNRYLFVLQQVKNIWLFCNKWWIFDDELFSWYGWLTKDSWPYFQTRPFSETLIIRNLRQAPAEFEPEFRLWWLTLCSSDNHYTTAPFLFLFAEHKHKDDDEENDEYEHKKKGILFLALFPHAFR